MFFGLFSFIISRLLSRGSVGEEGLKEERLNVFPCPMRGVICDYDGGV